MGDHAQPGATGTQLTLLTTGRPVDPDELADLYDYPQDGPDTRGQAHGPARPWVRANMITSLDGAATVSGRSGGLGDAGDRAVFAAMRATADVILVGLGTVRAEGYRGAHLPVAQRQRRQSHDQGEVPTIAVVTASGGLDPGMPLFAESEVAPIVVTSVDGAAVAADRVPGVQILVAQGAGRRTVDLGAALTALGTRGLTRVLCEGGPSLLGSLLEQRLVDEMCLTIAPATAAGAGRRIAASAQEATMWWRRVLLLGDGDGYLFTRHVRTT